MPPVCAPQPAVALPSGARAVSFSILVAAPATVLVLAQDSGFAAAVEKETGLPERLSGGAPFAVAGAQIFVIGSTPYCGGKTLYECVALQGA